MFLSAMPPFPFDQRRGRLSRRSEKKQWKKHPVYRPVAESYDRIERRKAFAPKL